MTPTPGRPTATPACPRRATDERVVLWLQNSHAAPIPAGAIALDRMGAERPVRAGSRRSGRSRRSPLDVGELLPGLRWPAQIEMRAGRHVVRPRYEVTRGDRMRIAHVNVERGDLQARSGDPARCRRSLGRGYPAAVPGAAARRDSARIVQPTPMAETQATLPMRLDVFDEAGRKVARAVPRLPAARSRPGGGRR